MRSSLFMCLTLWAAAAASGAVISVPDAGEGIVSIGDALERSIPGDVIEISPGTYHERLEITTHTLTLRGLGEVRIKGQVSPTGLSNPPVESSPTIMTNETEGIVLEDLIIEGSDRHLFSYGDSPYFNGQLPPQVGMHAIAGSVTLRRCTVAGGSGGATALKASGSELALEDCVLAGTRAVNGAPGFLQSAVPGDGATLTASSLTALRCEFVGGKGSDAVFTAPTIHYLPATRGAGGLFLEYASTAELDLCRITGGEGGDGIGMIGPPPEAGGVGLQVFYSSYARVLRSCTRGGKRGAGLGPAPYFADAYLTYAASMIQLVPSSLPAAVHFLTAQHDEASSSTLLLAHDATGDQVIDASDIRAQLLSDPMVP